LSGKVLLFSDIKADYSSQLLVLVPVINCNRPSAIVLLTPG